MVIEPPAIGFPAMNRMRLSLTAILASQTFLAGTVLAQTADKPQVLDEIVLSAEGDATGPVTGANPHTLTGSKAAIPVSEVPQSVSVISSSRLKATNVNKLDGALSYIAGVQGQPYGYDSDTNWVFIRGFAATATGSFQDGLPNFAYGFGGFYVDPYLVERIEVLKGPSSVLYGGSNPGGLVNYTTKMPGGDPRTEVELGVNEHGRAWVGVDHNGRLSERTDYRLLVKGERVDGQGAFDPGFHGVLSGSLRHLSNTGELTLGLDYTRVDETHVGAAWLPYIGTVTAAPFGKISRDFNTGEPGHDRYDRNQVALRMLWKQELGGWDFTNNTRLAWSKVEEDSVYAYGYSGFSTVPSDAAGTMSRLVFDHSTTARTFLNDARIERTVSTGALQHRLLFGLDFKYFAMDQTQSSASGTPLTFVNPAYGALQPRASAYIDQKMQQLQAGIYFQDQIRWGDGWIGTGNLRYDLVKTDVGTNYAAWGGPAAGYDRTDGKLSWRLGLAKELGGGVTTYVSTSSYFNPEIKADVTGTHFPPETGRQIEAGVKWSPTKDFLLTASLFDLERNNITQSSVAGVYAQLGKVRSRGVELEAQGELGHGVAVRAAFTRMKVEVRDDTDTSVIGKTPYSVPDVTAALELAWTPQVLPALTVTGGVRYTGDSWADNANTQKVSGRTLMDLGASYAFDNGLRADLSITNLTDKTFVASCQTAYWCYYGEGRTATVSLRKTF